MSFQEVLNAQRSLICSELGHSWCLVSPLEKHDNTQEVLCRCSTCDFGPSWIKLPAKGYERFLDDVIAGKIK